MRVDTFGREVMAHQATDRPARRRCPRLTAAEFLQLGLFRVGYVTAAAAGGGEADIVIHGADGLVVARADNVERAVDLADQLGLALVPVH